MTGFRSKFGGAQDFFDVEADITCLGKVIGGGFPVGAYGARNEIMQMVAPLGSVYQAGTLSGNPIAMAAGIATLKELQKTNPYSKMELVAKEIEKTLIDSAKENNVNIKVSRFGSMINPFFTEKEVLNFSDAQKSDTKIFAKFFWKLIENGVFIPPSQFEAWFLSTSLTKKDINKTKEAIKNSIKYISQYNV